MAEIRLTKGIEEIGEGIYLIRIPLPDNPLGALNSYLIIGEERNLLIDTGFFHPVCKSAMLEGFQKIGAKLSDTDIFLTHLHADHSGLALDLSDSETKIYCSRKDGAIVNLFASQEYWDDMGLFFSLHGMPDRKNDQDKGIHPGKLFGGRGQIRFETVEDGDIMDTGKYQFRCIQTPGHTPGHMCLYEENEKILFSGDHVLGDITPVLSPEKGLEKPLRAYLESLERIRSLSINIIHPGHRSSMTKPYERIEELKEHHRSRLNEIISILKSAGSPMNAYEVASKMSWKMRKKIWETAPRQQRWFATGEAIAHLLYLEEEGLVEVTKENGVYNFYLDSD